MMLLPRTRDGKQVVSGEKGSGWPGMSMGWRLSRNQPILETGQATSTLMHARPNVYQPIGQSERFQKFHPGTQAH